MISPSFNSTQSKASVNVKFARIDLQGGNWDIDMAKKHEAEMVEVLMHRGYENKD